VRKTRGDDIDAACGQLAGEVQDRTQVQDRMALLRQGLGQGLGQGLPQGMPQGLSQGSRQIIPILPAAAGAAQVLPAAAGAAP
jgi:hypothetical protein